MGKSERPICPNCRAVLILAPPPDGIGQRTFQCFDCDQPDPFKSERVAGWLAGELRSPQTNYYPSLARYEQEVGMPKFFFRYRTGDQLAPDLEGTELRSRAAARKMAFESARELMADAIKAGRRPPDAVIVSGEDGRDIMTIPTSEVLAATPKK